MLCFYHTLLMNPIIILVAVINRRPRAVFTLVWGLVVTTKEVAPPSLVR
jgi:hypothetical protein